MKTENNIAPGVISDQIPVIGFAECIRCGKCIAACPKEAIFMVPNPICGKCMGYCLMLPMSCYRDNVIISYERCDACGLCLEACSSGAISWFKLGN